MFPWLRPLNFVHTTKNNSARAGSGTPHTVPIRAEVVSSQTVFLKSKVFMHFISLKWFKESFVYLRTASCYTLSYPQIKVQAFFLLHCFFFSLKESLKRINRQVRVAVL